MDAEASLIADSLLRSQIVTSNTFVDNVTLVTVTLGWSQHCCPFHKVELVAMSLPIPGS